MIRALILIAALIGLTLLAAKPVRANTQCGPRDAVIAQLTGKYGESLRGIGMANNNSVMEVYASESGSWTITVTLPDGRMCLVASGQGYQTVDPIPAGVPL